MTPGRVHEVHGTPGSIFNGDMHRRKWLISQCLANQFWKRWIKEYLPAINLESKWHREQPDLKVNDIVIICDDNGHRNQLKNGPVASVYPGKDGRMRVADTTEKFFCA